MLSQRDLKDEKLKYSLTKSLERNVKTARKEEKAIRTTQYTLDILVGACCKLSMLSVSVPTWVSCQDADGILCPYSPLLPLEYPPASSITPAESEGHEGSTLIYLINEDFAPHSHSSPSAATTCWSTQECPHASESGLLLKPPESSGGDSMIRDGAVHLPCFSMDTGTSSGATTATTCYLSLNPLTCLSLCLDWMRSWGVSCAARYFLG